MRNRKKKKKINIFVKVSRRENIIYDIGSVTG